MANSADDGKVWMYLQDDGTWDFKTPEEKRKEDLPANVNPPNDGQVWIYLQDGGTWDFKTLEEKRKEKPPSAPNAPDDGHVLAKLNLKLRGRYLVLF
ncbi:hypothetical protein RUND412_005631 [Rhizina undulata]